MQLPLAIQNLKLHNQWRRGAEIDPLDPKEIGESIDVVVEAYEELMWKPIDPHNLPEGDVFVAAFHGGQPVFTYGRIVFEEDVDNPYLQCFVAHCGGSYVVDYVTHYLDPTKLPATNDQARG